MGALYDLIFGVFVLTFLATCLGNYIDHKIHTTPFLAITLGLLAIVFGLTRLVLRAIDLEKKERKDGK